MSNEVDLICPLLRMWLSAGSNWVKILFAVALIALLIADYKENVIRGESVPRNCSPNMDEAKVFPHATSYCPTLEYKKGWRRFSPTRPHDRPVTIENNDFSLPRYARAKRRGEELMNRVVMLHPYGEIFAFFENCHFSLI